MPPFSHLLFHKAGSLCCFTCLNICLMKIIHIIDIYIIYIFVWASDPFPELLPRPIFPPLHPIPLLSLCRPHPMPFDPKKGRGWAYFKTDLFYAFVIKANLFSKCAMSEWNQQMIRGDWAAASRSTLCPSLSSLPPPTPSTASFSHPLVCKGLVPRAHPESILRGQDTLLDVLV